MFAKLVVTFNLEFPGSKFSSNIVSSPPPTLLLSQITIKFTDFCKLFFFKKKKVESFFFFFKLASSIIYIDKIVSPKV